MTVTKITPSSPPRHSSHDHQHAVAHGHEGHIHHADEPSHDHLIHHGPADPTPHVAPPGYPSSDYVKYFAKFTSRGGDPKEAAHSYYRDRAGHLYNYDVEPEFAAPRQVKLAHIQGTPSRASIPDPHSSERNYVAAGKNFHSRVATGSVQSPSGNGPHHGYYFGNDAKGGKLLVGDTQIRF